MKNYGKANVKVEVLDDLPFISKSKQRFHFELSAHQWEFFLNSPYFSPFLTENVTDASGSFAACFPSKRKLWVDNIVKNNSADTTSLAIAKPLLQWTPILKNEGIVTDLINNNGKPYFNYVLPASGTTVSPTSDYFGPIWSSASLDREPSPKDNALIKKWLNWLESGMPSTTPTPPNSTPPHDVVLPQINYIQQQVTKDGLWWGIESDDFLNKNMPFWINIKRRSSPTSTDYPTWLVISLGIGDKGNAFDLILSNNSKPILIDYPNGREFSESTGKPPTNTIEFPTDLSRVLKGDKDLEIGFMTMGGRLIIYINKSDKPLIYTRVNKDPEDPKLIEADISAGKIRIYGTNSQMSINVSPMGFAPLSVIATPVPLIPEVSTSTVISKPPEYSASNEKNEPTKTPVCRIPYPAVPKAIQYGVDANKFTDANGTDKAPDIKGIGFHTNGEIFFVPLKSLATGGSPSPSTLVTTDENKNDDIYAIVMKPSDVSMTFSGTKFNVELAGCPYFFQLKGVAKNTPGSSPNVPLDISQDVIGITHTFSSNETISASANATITLYNKAGKYDYFKDRQKGIKIYMGWNDDGMPNSLFTGLSVAASSSEKSGLETIDVSCVDYNFILKNCPIINSPYYDGMILFFAIRDLALRTGLSDSAIIDDWKERDTYFLPSGFTFTKPLFKFEPERMIGECIDQLIKYAEAFYYFDGDGKVHFACVPGGIFSDTSAATISERFTRDPNSTTKYVILDEKNIDYSLESTVNRISIVSIERETRNYIIYNTSVYGDEDKLVFQRTGMLDQAALGSMEVVVDYAERLKKRTTKAIRKTSFRVAGFISNILPLSFIELDGDQFRVTAVTRTYSADNNDFNMQFNTEWMGG